MPGCSQLYLVDSRAWGLVNVEAKLGFTVAVRARREAGKQRVPAAWCADGLAQAAWGNLSSGCVR